MPDSASLDSAAGTSLSRSVAFWFKTTTSSNLVVLEKGTNLHFVTQTEGGGTAGRVSFRVNSTSTPRVLSLGAVNDGSWHHLAATYNGVGDLMQLYIDGLFQSSNTQASPAANNSPLVIGARDGGTFPFPGSMDDLGIWNRVLTSREVFAIYRSGVAGTSLANVVVPPEAPPTYTAYTWAVLKDNPRFYWSFNESWDLDDAVDHVRGQANNRLAPAGDATRSAGYSPNLDRAATFDGLSDFYRANALGDHQMPGAWAVEMWVKAEGSGITPPGASGYRNNHLLNAGTTAAPDNPAVMYDYGDDGVDNEVELYSTAGRTDGGPRINDTNWHHLVLTFYGNGAGFGVANRVDVAFDGVVTPNIARGGFSSGFNLNDALVVGASLVGANSFQGKIDELAIYDLSGLTEAQVAARTAALATHYALASGGAATSLAFGTGMTYSSSPAPAGGGGLYADPSNTKLTDGVIGSSHATGSSAWGSGLWAGWQWNDPVITFNLGAPSTLDAAFIHYLVAYAGGVRAPDSVLVQFSMNGTDFASIPSILSMDFNDFDTGTGAGWVRRSVVNLGGTNAQYVRFSFTNDAEWTFLGEIQFVLDTTIIPEPATVGLVAAGLLALFHRRRRQK